jgi:hypothetical protein
LQHAAQAVLRAAFQGGVGPVGGKADAPAVGVEVRRPFAAGALGVALGRQAGGG